MPVQWSRPETFGAWVRLDDATLVAVDDTLAARLEVPHGHALGDATRPLELHVAVTSRCPAPCEGCYLDAKPDGEEPSFDTVAARLASARDASVSMVAFGGGEPLTRADLGELGVEARRLGLVPVLTTSGLGLTDARAAELGAFAQINVSHDGVGGGYARVRGFDGASAADRAIVRLVAAGVVVGVNVVLTRDSFEHLEATVEHVADLGAVEVQLLRYKPAGRAASEEYAARILAPEQVDALWSVIARVVAGGRVRVRIDCAMVPLIGSALLDAVPDAAGALASLGVFGCEAARHLGAMRVDGTIAGCSFFSLPYEPIAIGRGPAPVDAVARSVTPSASVAVAWDADVELTRLRAYHAAPPEPCRSCPLFAVCRGGCQIVSRHDGGGFAPDPECPRVRAHAAVSVRSDDAHL